MTYDGLFTSLPYETSSLVLDQRRFFSCDILIKHWQLRNLISSDRPNVINYVSVSNVLQLDLSTNRVSLIAELAFIPRCSASGFGYICAAGEDGGLISIINTNTSESAEVDEQVHMPGIQQRDRSAQRPDAASRPPTVKTAQIGSSIINSITIYKLEGDPKAGICDDIVAVVTNNDETVRILSLYTGHETAVLDVPFAVNHATISPDGQTLVAVGDHQQAHFFEKITLNPRESRISTARYAGDHCRWVLLNVVRLHYPMSAGISGYFSSAWSSSGALCAVASENGYITVMDVKKVLAEEPSDECIVKVISSTRPQVEPGPGSIRTLHFSRQPWEVLVWSEGRGRICVADMRYGLDSRQTLQLESDLDINFGTTSLIQATYDKDVQPALLRELTLAYLSPRYAQLMQHMRSVRDQARAGSPSASHLSPRRYPRRRLGMLLHDEDYSVLQDDEELAANERQALTTSHDQNVNADGRIILEMLQSANGIPEPVPPPRSIRYRRAELHGSAASTSDSAARLAERQDHMTEAMNMLRRHRAEPELFDPDNMTSAEAYAASRRWQSSYDGASTSGMYAGNVARRLRSNMMDEDVRESAHESRARQQRAIEDDAVAKCNLRFQRAREREERLRHAYRLTEQDKQLLHDTSTRNREDGPPSAGLLTAGVIVSSDGQTIWAGYQEGIFEFKLNRRDLMNFPSLEAR